MQTKPGTQGDPKWGVCFNMVHDVHLISILVAPLPLDPDPTDPTPYLL